MAEGRAYEKGLGFCKDGKVTCCNNVINYKH